MIPLDSPQPTYTLPKLIPDVEEDKPIFGKAIVSGIAGDDITSLVFGAAPLSTIYNKQDSLDTPIPYRTVRLALRYGINAFDTSAFYGASEIILGQILQALAPEFPRASYKLMTKCGRYGGELTDFDYSPSTVRRSVERSLKRLDTDYLDVVYLHDIEFHASRVIPEDNSGDHAAVFSDPSYAAKWGLVEGEESKIHDQGDRNLLDGFMELRKMQEEGIIKKIGITGYPLPTLLRLSLLILHTTGKPLDILLSYSNYNLQNTLFTSFLPALTTKAKIAKVLTASPFSMGLLTPNPPPWHPAPPQLKETVSRIASSEPVKSWPGGMPNVALGFSFRRDSMGTNGMAIPNVVGFSTPREVHESVAVWREIKESSGGSRRRDVESAVRDEFAKDGWLDKAWRQGFME